MADLKIQLLFLVPERLTFCNPMKLLRQPSWEPVFLKLLQRRWSSLPHRLRLLITQRLSVNIWPLSFSETQHPLTWMCSAAHAELGTSKHRNKCTGKTKVGILTCWNKHRQAYYSAGSSHPWPFVCVWLEHKNTYRCILTAFVNHDECGGAGSQRCNLFRTHKGGVYSISMVIKPDWKACGHSCVRVFVSHAHTKGRLDM